MCPRIFTAALLCLIPLYAADPDGEALFKQRCATCHDGAPQPRMPLRTELSARTPEAIYRAMFEGAMKPQADGLSEAEGRAIATFVTGKAFGTVTTTSDKCTGTPAPIRL